MEYSDVLTSLEKEKVLSDDIKAKIDSAIKECSSLFTV